MADIHDTTHEDGSAKGQRLYDMLSYNKEFVERGEFKQYRRKILPSKRVVVVTCMDTRLTHLLPHALNLRDGDAKIIKNAGAVITHPFGGIMRSVMVAIYELNADEVFVIGHHDCGMTHIDPNSTVVKMLDYDIPRHTLVTLQYSGIDVRSWLRGFKSVEDSVRSSVDIIRNHPLMPAHIACHGLIIDPNTGKLDMVVDGNKELPVLTGGVPHAHAEWLASLPLDERDLAAAAAAAANSPRLAAMSGKGASELPTLSIDPDADPAATATQPCGCGEHHGDHDHDGHHHHHHHHRHHGDVEPPGATLDAHLEPRAESAVVADVHTPPPPPSASATASAAVPTQLEATPVSLPPHVTAALNRAGSSNTSISGHSGQSSPGHQMSISAREQLSLRAFGASRNKSELALKQLAEAITRNNQQHAAAAAAAAASSGGPLVVAPSPSAHASRPNPVLEPSAGTGLHGLPGWLPIGGV